MFVIRTVKLILLEVFIMSGRTRRLKLQNTKTSMLRKYLDEQNKLGNKVEARRIAAVIKKRNSDSLEKVRKELIDLALIEAL